MAQPPKKGSSSTDTEPGNGATSSQPSSSYNGAGSFIRDEPPPLYSEVVDENRLASNAAPPPHPNHPRNVRNNHTPGVTNYRYPVSGKPHSRRVFTLPDPDDTPIDEQVRKFTNRVKNCIKTPPRVFVRLLGTHFKRYRNNDRDTSRRQEVDFDIQLELTPYLFSDAEAGTSWSTLLTPADHEKALRRIPYAQAMYRANNNNRIGDSRPSSDDWCRWFYEDPKKLKDFRITRYVNGIDYECLRSKLDAIVRRTNYRGDLEVSFPEKEHCVEFYNDHTLNEIRQDECCQVLSVLTCLCIFWAPYIASVTNSYDIMTVKWSFSRTNNQGRREYVSMSEDEWCNTWERAIVSGVLSMRQGTLDEEDLRRAQGVGATFRAARSPAADEDFNPVREGVHFSYPNQIRGWGGDC
ncbi:MAG: hypothetical protein SEPTF4163_004806 [Sporothrix epigloea]